ncbi:MAG TPA: NAD-dependent epimerase/dehydratase family protein, partial [Gemmataceae bacterium]|nr:NAD-dependent epimerase/dehydratase family protein [Gemmataceae bacterium]
RTRIVTEDLQSIAGSALPFQELAGKVVFISGGNGFLPAYMVETLLYLNEIAHTPAVQIVALVRNGQKAKARFANYRHRSDLHLLVQDVCNPISIDGPVDTVIHAASQASPKFFGSDPAGTLSANVLGTRNLLELARAKKSRRFLFFSSAEVYGQLDPGQIPAAETACGRVDPLDVRSCYAESKRMGETMCVSWCQQYGVPARIVRPFHTYGPGMALDDGRVFSDLVAAIVEQHDIVLQSDGAARRAYCYLSDAVRGFFTVLFHGENGSAYNVGNTQAEISVRDLAQKLVALFPEKCLKVIHAASSHRPGYLPSRIPRVAPDTTKLAALGWRPKYGIEDGFKRTILSFQ